MSVFPTRKVTAATFGAAVAEIAVWAIGQAVEVPTTVEAAIVTLCVFAAGWSTYEREPTVARRD